MGLWTGIILTLMLFVAGAWFAHQRGWAHSVNIFITLATFLTVFTAAEILCRAVFGLVRGIKWNETLASYQHETFGWQGRREFGDLHTTRQRILILGDSFTEGMGVAPEKLYYQQLHALGDVELFVYAGRGYGSLQELLALDEFLHVVKPDLVILQVCSNDFINNYRALEVASFQQNILAVRPYLEDGQVTYKFSSPFGAWTGYFAEHSRVVHLIRTRAELLLFSIAEHGLISGAEEQIAKEGLAYQPFRESVTVTEEIMRRFHSRVLPAPLFVFLADAVEPNETVFREIFHKLGIPFTEVIAQELLVKRISDPASVTIDSVHWNERGHALAGRLLLDQVRRKFAGFPNLGRYNNSQNQYPLSD